jgi:3-oxoisoapionate decarboxylase
MQRRQFIQRTAITSATACMLTSTMLGARGSALAGLEMGVVIHSYGIRSSKPLNPNYGPIDQPLEFLELARSVGAVGIQTRLDKVESAETLRQTAQRHGMYVEGSIGLPKDELDVERFESQLLIAKRAGANILRSVCMSGRRYEVMRSMDQFRAFEKQSLQSLKWAASIAEKHRVQLAIENHKDWHSQEMLKWLSNFSSEWLGVCIDTGNSIALLEDPYKLVETLAPWVMTTHLKDMGLAEYDDGFLLAEVPLGQGVLDLPRIIATLRKAKPDIHLNLEMITRDPLKIPCLTDNYWVTLQELPAHDLAHMLSMVRKRGTALDQSFSTLGHEQQLRLEHQHVLECMRYHPE